jgi:hypothetical protein
MIGDYGSFGTPFSALQRWEDTAFQLYKTLSANQMCFQGKYAGYAAGAGYDVSYIDLRVLAAEIQCVAAGGDADCEPSSAGDRRLILPIVGITSGAGPTAICRDGTYSYSQTHEGTCSHHGGVSSWQ